MSSDTDKIIFAGQKLANALAGLFGSEEDSLVADSPPSFGYESPYYKGHPSYKSPTLRTMDFVPGWDDDDTSKLVGDINVQFADEINRGRQVLDDIAAKYQPLVESRRSGGYGLPTHGFGDMDGYGLPKDMPEDMKREVLKRYPIK